jgi:hypothetical protein
MLMRNAPIILLDEATSALDSESELVVQKVVTGFAFHSPNLTSDQALDNVLSSSAGQRTSVVIAHRLSTIVRRVPINPCVFDVAFMSMQQYNDTEHQVHCSKILLIKRGRVAEEGAPNPTVLPKLKPLSPSPQGHTSNFWHGRDCTSTLPAKRRKHSNSWSPEQLRSDTCVQ